MSGYYKTKESVAEYIEAAKDVNGSRSIEKLKSFLPSGASVLELGTGPGTDWELLKRDYNVTGSDNSLVFLEHLQAENPTGKFIELDASTLDTESTFSGIYSNKVLHHLTDEELDLSIARQAELLNEGGIISHTFWKGEGSEIFKGLFVNYHDETAIDTLFRPLFETLFLEPYAEFEAGDSILLIARKK